MAALVPVVYVVLDGPDQLWDGGERPSPDALLRDDVEPDLDLVQPRAPDRCEVELDPWVLDEPRRDVFPGVGGEVVQDDVYVCPCRGTVRRRRP